MRPVIAVSKTVTVDTRHEITVSGKQLLDLLRASGLNIPDNADVEFTVPGGGDWSNMSIDVDHEHPITVSWKTHSVESAGA